MESQSVTVAADLSSKIIILCSKYFVNVAHARAEVERLKEQLKSLETTLRQAKHLLEHPNSQSLSASRELNDPIQKCQAELQRLRDKLEPNTKEKTMSKFGLRAAKWPFSKGEVEAVITSLVEYREAITAILQIDQTKLLLDINHKIENLSLQSTKDRSVEFKALFIMPFPRDPDFVDRPVLRGWLEEQYNASPARRLALVGMGGFGKSQIAIEFAYRVHIASPETSVFWVHGGTEAKFEESYRSLANALALPDRHDPSTNVLALVRDWLQRIEAPPWLIILDNADEMETFFPSKSHDGENQREPLASYLPKTGSGKIVITSRSRSVTEKLTGSHKAIQEVSTMDSLEALKILENKLSQEIDQDGAIYLARALDFIPLAVNQAAAYINRRAPRVSIRSYLEEFQQSEKQKKSLLNRDAGDLRRREDVSNSVVITWQVTFEQIRQERPSAANLLLLMSFFQPQNIPEFMLSDYDFVISNFEDMNDDNGEDLDEDSDEDSDEDLDEDPDEDLEDEDRDGDLKDDLDVLRGYSLIRLSTTSGLCDMHALVQFCTRVWLLESDGNHFARLKSLFLDLSAEHFPDGTFDTWATCQLLLPHMKPLMDEKVLGKPDIFNWCELLENVSWYMREIGNYSAAETIAQTALDASRRLLGNEHRITLDLIHLLSVMYQAQCRFDEAELLVVQAMETSTRVWGDKHPKTLVRMSHLVHLFVMQGKYVDAESLLMQMIEMSKSIRGDEHPETLKYIFDLVSIYTMQGRLAEAEPLCLQLMETSKRILGEEHDQTLSRLGFLANIHKDQGRLADAELLATRVIEIRKRVLGDEHPDVLAPMNDLAYILKEQERWQEAESLFLQVLETKKKVLGEEHPGTLDTMISLSHTLKEQGKYTEAGSLYAQVIETRKKVLGDEHLDTLVAMNFLMLTLYVQERLDEAESICVQLVEVRKRVLGDEHADTLTATASLAFIFDDLGRSDDALELLRRAVLGLQRIAGPGHEETVFGFDALKRWERRQLEVLSAQECSETG
ncbi:hypothetical protein TGAM01_v205220 [Trichoderma gamsii]|uniref:NB-ARC domain-containing protein n=1 Tax=Trichoderma gamsii TaxID=398673 RepID=A0A2P4ZNB6_9HYPO|nr:hypothetical protein TGAM01_v205220 [Trichoderma gamsii]PON25783.1 hypothetical protein TGAM01_v205220 [Trichoderma gamsii]